MNLIFQQPGTAFPAGKWSYDIDRSVKAFLFKFAWTPGSGPVQDAANTPIKNVLPPVNVTSYVTTKNAGQVKVCTSFPLSALMEYAANGEGAIQTRSNPANALEIIEISGWVDITPLGALHMDNDEQIRLQLEDLPTAAAFNLTVFGLEAPVLDYSVLTYDQFSLASNVKERTFDLTEVDTLILPTTGGVLKELLFRYSNGVAARYTEDELRHICQNSNDLAVAGAINAYGFSSHYVIDTANAVAVDVVTSGAGYVFYAVGDNPATKPSTVAAKNQQLETTSDARRIEKATVIDNK